MHTESCTCSVGQPLPVASWLQARHILVAVGQVQVLVVDIQAGLYSAVEYALVRYGQTVQVVAPDWRQHRGSVCCGCMASTATCKARPGNTGVVQPCEQGGYVDHPDDDLGRLPFSSCQHPVQPRGLSTTSPLSPPS